MHDEALTEAADEDIETDNSFIELANISEYS